MYGKHFESMYEGSMYGAGLAVFAVWGFVIAHARDSRVELNPNRMADTLGGTTADIQNAIDYLLSADPKSRHKEHDGKRLLKEGEYQYFVPSWEAYQSIRNEVARREYNKLKKREERAKNPPKKKTIKLAPPSPGVISVEQYDGIAKTEGMAAADKALDESGG